MNPHILWTHQTDYTCVKALATPAALGHPYLLGSLASPCVCRSILTCLWNQQVGGHYKAVCRAGALWLVFNDRSVRKVGANGLETSYGCKAYILCYEHKSKDILPPPTVPHAPWALPLPKCCGGSQEQL